jgi:PIN domain nuclease of toxin-antitoxin system
MKPILLDTCALIWLANGEPMSASALELLGEAEPVDGAIVVSPISAWEIGLLVARGRLALKLDPRDWFDKALGAGIALAAMPPEVLIASSFLPPSDLRDPADRIIAATARAFGYRVMTRDAPLLAFGTAGQMEAIAC